jgi:hypothetical protein
MAWRLGKIEDYHKACYLLGKYLLGGFNDTHTWGDRKPTRPTDRFHALREWNNHYVTACWTVGMYPAERGLVREHCRFVREHLLDPVQNDISRLEAFAGQGKLIMIEPSREKYSLPKCQADVERLAKQLEEAGDEKQRKRLQVRLEQARESLARLYSPLVGTLQAMGLILDYPVEKLKQLGADVLTLALRDEAGHWERTIKPGPAAGTMPGIDHEGEGIPDYMGRLPWLSVSQERSPYPWGFREEPGSIPAADAIRKEYGAEPAGAVSLSMNRAVKVTAVEPSRRPPLKRDDTVARITVPDSTNGVTEIEAWHCIGPFDNAEDKGFDAVLPPEERIDLAAVYPGLEGAEIEWREVDQRGLTFPTQKKAMLA